MALDEHTVVGIVGAGTMGSGIAQVAAAAGHDVLVFDQDDAALQRSQTLIESSLQKRVERGRLSKDDKNTLQGRIKHVLSLQSLAEAGLVMEAIVEDLKIKQNLFVDLESLCSEDTILATNTSSLSVTAIGSVLKATERFLGLHFFNPAPAMKLVEIVKGLTTSSNTVEQSEQLMIHWDKHPVRTSSTPGFIVNRVARPFYAEALRILQEQGTNPVTLDTVMRECGGFKMGPLELMDLIGHDVNYAVTCSVYEAFYQDARFRPNLIQKALVDAGRLGRKSGRGFYQYLDEHKESPNTMEKCSSPKAVQVCGELQVAQNLIKLLAELKVEVTHSEGDGYFRFNDVTLAMTDGRTATQRSVEDDLNGLILFDLAKDYVEAERVALARADQASEDQLRSAAGLFQALGKEVSVIDDVPGMIVSRTVCMLANEAADAVNQGVCDVETVNMAMRFGTAYPLGPLDWAEQLGLNYVITVLSNLQSSYGEDRYRVSPWLKRKYYKHGGI